MNFYSPIRISSLLRHSLVFVCILVFGSFARGQFRVAAVPVSASFAQQPFAQQNVVGKVSCKVDVQIVTGDADLKPVVVMCFASHLQFVKYFEILACNNFGYDQLETSFLYSLLAASRKTSDSTSIPLLPGGLQ